MESSSKLADLTLVSKYYPIANYSYPRSEPLARYGAGIAATADRSSLGSEASAPGLIDDRTDSEVSVDDDYQYHAHGSELWDSFWQPGVGGMKKEATEQEVASNPRKQYPALIPSPQRQRRRANDGEPRSPGWPLPDSPGTQRQQRSRQPGATYTPFPKPIALPRAGRSNTPSWESSRPRAQPKRPARPDERLLTPCIRQKSPVKTVFTSVGARDKKHETCTSPSASSMDERSVPSEYQRPATSLSVRPSSPTEVPRPQTSQGYRPAVYTPTEPRRPKSSRSLRPLSPLEVHNSKMSLANRPPTPFEPPSPCLQDTAYFEAPEMPKHRKGYHKYSNSRLTPDPEPRSFFEEDSDNEEEPGRSFFRFHKRSKSELRHSTHTPDPETPRRRRGRTSPSPTRVDLERKRNGVDVFGRMLGRRSR